MLYHRRSSQVSYGEAIGILLLDSPVPFIPGDVANATSYDFPVRYKKVDGFTVKKALEGDEGIYSQLLRAGRDLKNNGVRAITGDCGFMALHQNRLKKDLDIPVFLSSLLQIHFIRHMLPDARKIGIITASQMNLSEPFLEKIGIQDITGLALTGLEDCPEFRSAVLDEKGSLNSSIIESEVLDTVQALLNKYEDIGAILLECSVLPPYARVVAEQTGLPVFDYMTMINFVFHAVVKKSYNGFM
ncbi:MAG: aspartate/glutamate racemase family protein [Desulfobacterales bacterium]|nr:aspartate/glutamate racemase family protein [Desulfobacterales bacterium]